MRAQVRARPRGRRFSSQALEASLRELLPDMLPLLLQLYGPADLSSLAAKVRALEKCFAKGATVNTHQRIVGNQR